MTEYETIFILRPEWTSDQVRALTDRLTALVNQAGGAVFHMKEVGRRRLAYRVNKQTKGIYVYANYAGGGSLHTAGGHALVTEIERTLRLEEDVLKFLTVRGTSVESVEARRAKALEEEARLAQLFGAGSETPAAGTEGETFAQASHP